MLPAAQCRAGKATSARLYDGSVIEQVPAEEWESWVAWNHAVVLDVREAREWDLGTLPGSLLVSMTELVERIDELPKDRPILCVCRSGSRSQQVAAYLTMNGFGDVANLSGGLKALGMQD
jgi:rhodanese-related sulfurtransferase